MPQRALDTLDHIRAEETASLGDFKACLKQGAEELARRFHADEPVEQLVRLRADFIDAVLQRVWQQHMPAGTDAALIAVGGYGRRELHPASDVDVLILTAEAPETLAEPLEQLIMFLWDIGLEIGHSVRTVDECVAEARNDLTVVTNLMESRLLAGNGALFDAMRAATGPDKIWPSDAFFSGKAAEQERRHAKYDDSAYNLEPNIKENPGGLRDIQMIGWVAKRHFGATTMADLKTHGFLTDAEYQALMAGQSFLWRIRFALHLLTGRHDDRLMFDQQRTLARDFGYQDDDANLAVEQFMQKYYRTVMELNRLNEMLLQLFREATLLHGKLGEPVRINARFQTRNDYLELTNEGIFARYPLALLEVFLVLEQHPQIKGVRATTIRSIRAHRHLIDDHFRNDIRSRSLFMEILRQPAGITHQLRRMNRYGILERYLPVFRNIVGRMQHDLFHVYTVDEHTLMLIRNLRRFSVPEFAKEFPLCSEVFQHLPKPELIYVAGLFHDIAKGRGGNHAVLGEVDARAFCQQHQLPAWDTELVAWLVLEHLTMSHTAQQMDIEDPEVVQAFARKVKTLVRLDYLYLLTVADIRATNPARWNSWKASLLGRLYRVTQQALQRGLDSPQEPDDIIQNKQAMARAALLHKGIDLEAIIHQWMAMTVDYFLQANPDEIIWHTEMALQAQRHPEKLPMVELRAEPQRGCNELLVICMDREGLFANTTALLDQLGLNIQGALIQTLDNGLTMNSFFLLEGDGSLIAAGPRTTEILSRLQQQLQQDPELEGDSRRSMPRVVKHFATPISVEISQDLTNQRTVLNIRATDRPGLLSNVGWVFARLGIILHHAKIATYGIEVDDAFYITDKATRPILDEAVLDALRQQLEDRLNPVE